MQRPVWTLCLFFLWLCMIPAIIYTHIAVGKLVPGINDLPGNLDKGFNTLFGFALLEADAQNIMAASKDALTKCDSTLYNASDTTKANPGCTTNPTSTDTAPTDVSKEKSKVDDAFASSLTKIKRVTSDKYLGTVAMNNTNAQLTVLIEKQKTLAVNTTNMSCVVIVPTFCAMDASAVSIVSGVSTVTAEIQKFTNSDMVKLWKDNKTYFQALHGIPYVLVVAFLSFTFFWWKGGVCCCCRNGTLWGCITIPIFLVFWLTALVMWSIIAGSGVAIYLFSKDMRVPVLKGEPNLWEVTKHFETAFPVFWQTVFADLYDGATTLLPCAIFFTIVTLLIGMYACCESCCCPYRQKKEAQGAVDPIAVFDKA